MTERFSDNRIPIMLAAAIAFATLVMVATSFLDPASLVFYGGAAVLAVILLAATERPAFAIVLLVGAAALDVNGRIATIGPLKVTAYQGLVALFLVLLAYRVRKGTTTLKRTALDGPMLLYLSLVAVSTVGAYSTSTALVQAVSLASSALLAYAVVWVAEDDVELRAIILGTLVIAVGIGILGIAERYEIYSINGYLRDWGGATIRAKATFKDPNIMGSFQMTAIALALPLALTFRRLSARIALVFGVLIAGIGLATTASRGALGAMIIALVVILVLSRARVTTKIVVLLVTGALGLFALTYIASPQWIETRVTNVETDKSAMARIYMAESALQMAEDYPLGIGVGNYSQLYPYYRNAEVRADLIESHTTYLTILVETGILGLLAFLGLLATYAFLVFKVVLDRSTTSTVHAAAVGSLAAVIGMSAQAFTYSLESSKYWWLAVGIGLAAVTLAASNASANKGQDRSTLEKRTA